MIPANVWEQSSTSDSIKNGSNGHHDNGNDLEIDLDELDEYYDELQRITDYLEKELPKVIPTIANDKTCVAKLANSILSRSVSSTVEFEFSRPMIGQLSTSLSL